MAESCIDRARSILIGPNENWKWSTYSLRRNTAWFPGLDWGNNMAKFDKDGICYWAVDNAAQHGVSTVCSWVDKSNPAWSEANSRAWDSGGNRQKYMTPRWVACAKEI